MRIYLICPVRNASSETLERLAAHVARLEAEGHEVHFPPRDVEQEDPSGGPRICRQHLAAMVLADETHIVWDKDSGGSHFDLGMAYALGKKAVLIESVVPDGPGKSYEKVIRSMTGGPYVTDATQLAFRPGSATESVKRPLARGVSLTR